MSEQQITFTGVGRETLVGTLDLPDDEPESYALMAHCFTGGRNHPATRRISRELADRGLAVLRFDFTGFGDSGGRFAESTFSSNVADMVLAAAWLRQHHGAPTLMLGHSLGGLAAVAAATQVPEVRAVATIGSPADPAHLTHLFAGILDQVERDGSADVVLAGTRLRITTEFIDDLRRRTPQRTIADLGVPLLVLHAPDDELVELSNANQIFWMARHPKSFICLDGADHLLTDPRQADRVAQLVAAWADPYLPDSFTPERD